MGERTALTGELDITGRVKVLEHSVEKLENRVEVGFASLEKALSRLAETVSAHRPAIPFKEIAATAALCMGILAYIDNYVVTRIKGAQEATGAVIEWRLKEIEKKVAAR